MNKKYEVHFKFLQKLESIKIQNTILEFKLIVLNKTNIWDKELKYPPINPIKKRWIQKKMGFSLFKTLVEYGVTIIKPQRESKVKCTI